MMYRFGWKKADKVFYYSEFLGMADNIQEGDMLIDVTKTDLQQQNEKLTRDFELIKEQLRESVSKQDVLKMVQRAIMKTVKN